MNEDKLRKEIVEAQKRLDRYEKLLPKAKADFEWAEKKLKKYEGEVEFLRQTLEFKTEWLAKIEANGKK